MAKFADLLNGGYVQIEKKKSASRKKTSSAKELGCEHCPIHTCKDGRPAVNKVKNIKNIQGRRIFVWAQNPGKREDQEGKELIGPAGKFFWDAMDSVGLSREDCDIQNIVRCRSLAYADGEWEDRAPTKDEIKCCSIYNQNAIERNGGKAKVYIVLGQLAAQALLKREYRKDNPVFWSETLKAHVICLDHPAYFLRGAPRWRLETFYDRLRSATSFLKGKGQYAYLEAQDYGLIKTYAAAKRFLRRIKKEAIRRKIRVSIDIESGWVKDGKPSTAPGAKEVILGIGFSIKPGSSRHIVLDHPENDQPPVVRNKIKRLVSRFLEDARIEKTFHYGCSDSSVIKRLLAAKVRGYNFDTNYSIYLKNPNQKKCGLDECSKIFFPAFSGYKKIVAPYVNDELGNINFARIPLKIMKLYNGADCDLAKRLERRTKDVSLPLLKTYVKVSFTLLDMQGRGPYFDKKYYKQVASRIPAKCASTLKKIRKIAKNKEFNPASPLQVKNVVYNILRLPKGLNPKKPESTDKTTLDLIYAKTKHEFPKLLKEWRGLSKMEGTYLSNYEESAKLHDGQVRTQWWLTGTITGRLRSGGKEEAGIVNLQNLHGDPMMQNLLVADPKWRKLNKLLPSGFLEQACDYKDKIWDKIKELAEKQQKNPWDLFFPKLWSKIDFDGFFAKAWRKYKEELLDLQVFLGFDYKAIEVRILAEMSNDELLIKQFQNKHLDIHAQVGHALTGWTYDAIMHDKKTRTLVKNVHFGIIFGMIKKSLRSYLEGKGVIVTEQRAGELYDAYFAKYTGVRRFIDRCREVAEKTGYADTLFGFRRPITTAEDSDRGTYWGNQAVNSPIQGTAHQLMLSAMAILHDKPKTYNLLREPMAEIHDALYFYTTLRQMASALKQGHHLLEVAVPAYIKKIFGYSFRVPLLAEAKEGFRLGVTEEYEGDSAKEFCKRWVKKNLEEELKIADKWGRPDLAMAA